MMNIINNASRTALRVVFSAVLMFIASFFIRAQESTMRVYYKFDNATVYTDYLSNPEVFAQLDAVVSGAASEGFEIVTFSSPEGNFDYNYRLAQRRAESLRNWVYAKYPQLNGKVSISPNAESWVDLRSKVESDSRLSEEVRSKILVIIDSDKAADAKESALKALPEYRAMYSNYFRTLRFAEIRLAAAGINAGENVVSGSDNAAPSATGSAFGSTGTAASSVAVSNSPRADVIFALRSAEIDQNSYSNRAVLAAVASMLEGKSAEDVAAINIVSSASPEGPVALNNRYSVLRGQALRNYIVSAYPELAGKISVRSAGEAWDDLKSAVESDPSLSEASRSKLLSIIVSDAEADAKEAKLRALPEWKHLFEDVFPSLRYARINVSMNEAPADNTDIPAIAGQGEISIEDEILTVKDSTLHLSDSTITVPAVTPVAAPADTTQTAPADTMQTTVADTVTTATEPVQEPTPYVDNTRPIFAASTNLVYDFGGLIRPLSWTPNFALELPIGQKWSVYGEYAFPWWVTGANDQAWQILKWDIGARRWLSRHNKYDRMDVLRGHFIGIDLGAGYYDIEPRHTGYQGEFQTVSLEYGYAFRLSRAWRLDLFGGLGWLGTHYRYYEGDSTDEHLLYRHHGKMDWFGPVKAGISIKYIFHKSEEGRNGR